MTYRLGTKAAEDLVELLRHGFENFGDAAAEGYYRGLIEALTFIADYPRAARERTEITPPVRVHAYKSHMILYEIDGADVVILRVRHGREDWQPTR